MKCWVWGRGKTTAGYGTVKIEGKTQYVHRLSYEAIIGAIPTGYDIDHLCRTPACYNPEHLESVTHKENLRRGKGHGRETHCPKGHPYSGDNLYIRKQSRGGGIQRACKECRRAQTKAWRDSPRYAVYRRETKEDRMDKQRKYRARNKQHQEAQESGAKEVT